jgi:hypothetical protein
MNWYPKDKSIEQDLVPIKSCKTCTYQYGFNDLICLECCQLSNWKEVESSLNPFNEKESEVSTESLNGKGGRLYVESQTGPCPNYADEIDRIIAEMEKSIIKILNRLNLFEAIKNYGLNDDEYDCPIHGKLGGIDECPRC